MGKARVSVYFPYDRIQSGGLCRWASLAHINDLLVRPYARGRWRPEGQKAAITTVTWDVVKSSGLQPHVRPMPSVLPGSWQLARLPRARSRAVLGACYIVLV